MADKLWQAKYCYKLQKIKREKERKASIILISIFCALWRSVLCLCQLEYYLCYYCCCRHSENKHRSLFSPKIQNTIITFPYCRPFPNRVITIFGGQFMFTFDGTVPKFNFHFFSSRLHLRFMVFNGTGKNRLCRIAVCGNSP